MRKQEFGADYWTEGHDGGAYTFKDIGFELFIPDNSNPYWINGKFMSSETNIYASVEGGRYMIKSGGALGYLDFAILQDGSAFYGSRNHTGSAAIRPIVTISLDKLDTDNSIVANGITTLNLK